MNYSLTNIKKLEKYLTTHDKDVVIESTISKLVEMKINQLNLEINDLKTDLKKFENKYNLKSADFFEKFNKGQMDDNLDFTDWIAIYKMVQNRISDKSLLAG